MDANNLTKEYSNGEVTIVWQSSKCIHAAQCVKNNPAAHRGSTRSNFYPSHAFLARQCNYPASYQTFNGRSAQ